MSQEPEPLSVYIARPPTILLSELLRFHKDLNWEFVQFSLTNNTEKPMRVFVRAEIADATYEASETLIIQPHETKPGNCSLNFDSDKIDKMTESKDSQIRIRCSYGFSLFSEDPKQKHFVEETTSQQKSCAMWHAVKERQGYQVRYRLQKKKPTLL